MAKGRAEESETSLYRGLIHHALPSIGVTRESLVVAVAPNPVLATQGHSLIAIFLTSLAL